MQHMIPIHVFPIMMATIQLITPADAQILDDFVDADDFIGFEQHMEAIGLPMDGIPPGQTRCKGLEFAIEVPDEPNSQQELTQCKSIW